MSKLPLLQMNQIEEFEAKRRTEVTRARAVVNYTMGILFLALGVYMALSKRMLELFPRSGNYIIGFMYLSYGIWRIYRGYRKNYFKD
jgi:hypothetical protein